VTESPFVIDGSGIERLDAAEFARLVNALLSAECAAQGLPMDSISITARINDPDGGVDASFAGSAGSLFVARGDSAWQFKLSPQNQDLTKDEVRKPGPQEVIAAGGHYYLAVATDFSDSVKRNRLKWLTEVVPDSDRVHVLNGSNIAAWASQYPAVLVALGLASHLRGLRSHQAWASFAEHRPKYVPGRAQQRLQAELVRLLSDPGGDHVRIEAPSGTGKTRTALEALSGAALAPLVVYAQREEELGVPVLDHFADHRVRAIIVIDNCNRLRHRQLTERLPRGASLRLVTMGDETTTSEAAAPYYRLGEMEPGELRSMLGQNYIPAISQHHIALVADNSGGSVRLALTFADRMMRMGETELANITTRSDMVDILKVTVPEGVPFVVASLLALLRRVGWEADLAQDGDALMAFAGDISPQAFRDAVAHLTATGLVARQGRYRLVTPNPLAIYLAAQLWNERSWEIVRDLLPALSADGQEALLARAAELGQYEPARDALTLVFSADGPFSSISRLEETGTGTVLRYLAVVNPEATMDALERIVAAPAEELRAARRSRRDLLWALEKCVWHSQYFTRAAAVLLLLALAENEEYANSATGIWVNLFSSRLPATAAPHAARLAYLRNLARTTDDHQTQLLVVSAAAQGVAPFEMHAGSGERQFGHVPEPQGGVRTQAEDIEYRGGMFEVLRSLAETTRDEEIIGKVTEIILSVVRAYLGTHLEELIIDQLDWLAGRDPQALRLAGHNWIRYQDYDRPTEGGWQRIETLLASIEPHDPWTRLLDLARQDPWSIQQPETSEDQALERFIGPVREIRQSRSLADFLEELAPLDMSSAAFVGASIAATSTDPQADWLTVLAFTGPDTADLQRGYIGWLDRTDTTYEMRDSALSTALEQGQLAMTDAVRYWLEFDTSPLGYAQVVAAIESNAVTVDEIARSLLLSRWLRQLDTDLFVSFYDALARNAATSGSRSSLLHVIYSHVRDNRHALDRLRERLELAVIVFPLERGPGVASTYEWAQACRILLPGSAPKIAERILPAAAQGHIHLDQSTDEARILNDCFEAAPTQVWDTFAHSAETGGGWRLTLGARFWLNLTAIEDYVIEWIEQSGVERIERARFAATVAPVHAAPSKLGVFLLNKFDDARIESSLAAAFQSGFFSGPESDHIRGKIQQLKAWKQQGPGARRWAAKVAASLQERLYAVEKAEAEGIL
jgi:hypothetical protein